MKIETDKNESHRAEKPWCIIFANYVVLVGDNKDVSGGELERWKEVGKRLKIG